MKSKLLLLSLFIYSSSLFAQIDISAGMGIDFVNSSSLKDYANFNFPSSEKISTFNSAVEFFVEGDYTLSENYQIGLEYSYLLFSYSANTYEISYGHHRPTLVGYYVIPGPGYKFKFGGGIGYRIVDLEEKIFSSKNYSSSGVGFLLRAQGHTSLGGNLYANVGIDFRYDMPGEPKDGDTYIIDPGINENVNINSLSIGIRLGVSYFIN